MPRPEAQATSQFTRQNPPHSVNAARCFPADEVNLACSANMWVVLIHPVRVYPFLPSAISFSSLAPEPMYHFAFATCNSSLMLKSLTPSSVCLEPRRNTSGHVF